MIAYVTKWWGTKGIIEVEGRLTDDSRFFHCNRPRVTASWHGDAHPTRELAVMAVKFAAARKARALAAQLAKVRHIVEHGL